jgi:Putative metal-binding motif
MDRLHSLIVACLLAAAGCDSQNAIVLNVSGDAPAEQYDLYVHDDDTGQIVFHSGFSSFSPPGSVHDITKEKVKLALKLSRGGRFTLLLVGVIGDIQGGKPAPTATQMFWAGRFSGGGTQVVDAPLITVQPGDDADRDLWPDVTDFRNHSPVAQQVYGGHPELLDCDDKTDNPMVSGMTVRVFAADVNPFANEICGDGYDENCNGLGDEPCVDGDHDGDFKGSDCDDNDPRRHHATMMDPFPDPPNCCGYNLGKTTDMDRATDYLHATGDPNCFAKTCARDMGLCPMQRCGDGIDEACASDGMDSKCVVDADCDGYPAPPQGNDCDDHDPNVHPNAPEPCDATKDMNCDMVVGGCVPCDLDGDGWERNDPTNGCPDAANKHPGMPADCNDFDSGVFPTQTMTIGGTEAGSSTINHLTSALRSNCRSVYESTGSVATGTNRVRPPNNASWMIGDADCNGVAFEGCPAAACDADGDGFPNAGAGCNPGGLPLDCNDNDPTIFPSAPDKCGDGIAQDCSADHPCTNDMDGDGYNGPGDDCDDNDRNTHPWAIELCDGKDNDCDGLVDEGNPDGTGMPLVAAGAVTLCTDSNIGECANTKGSCVCGSTAQPGAVYNPMRAACPTENDGPVPAPKCIGAGQPHPQTCDACNRRDDDCNGSDEDPMGMNLAILGQPCGINVGQCKAGLVVGCKYSPASCFGVFGAVCGAGGHSTDGYVCDGTAICPVAEICNGLDDDCNGVLPGNEVDADGDQYISCAGCTSMLAPGLLGCGDCNDGANMVHPNATEKCNGIDDDCNAATADGSGECTGGPTSTCCGSNGCKNLQTDFSFCTSCTMSCSLATANQCNATFGCSCGGGPSCTGGLTCNGAPGSCTKANGAGCGGNGECTSGHCVDGVCCSAAACGTCQTCNGASPGTCSNLTNVDDPDTCTGANTCNGSSQCRLKNGQACPGGATTCASAHCVDGVCCGSTTCATCQTCNGGSPGTCTNVVSADDADSCTGNNTCDATGVCKLKRGQGCTLTSQCATGVCSDTVCCDTTCSGQCQSCKEAGNVGTCQTISGAPRSGHTACTNLSPGCGGTCDGVTAASCAYPGGTQACGPTGCASASQVYVQGACNGGGNCSGNTQVTCTGNFICTGGACLGACTTDTDCALGTQYCNAAGACVNRKGSGASCNAAAGADCKVANCRVCSGAGSGFCRFGVCCDGDCNGGNASSCSAGSVTTFSCPAGTCTSVGPTPCAPYKCSGAVCANTCSTDTDCVGLFWCAAPSTTPNPGGTAACVARYTLSGATCHQSDCNSGTSCLQCFTGTPAMSQACNPPTGTPKPNDACP